jgi:hypothetical protein
MDNTIRLLLGFLGTLVIGLMFFIVDMLNTTSIKDSGVVIGMAYSPEQTTTGSGVHVNPSNGQVTPIVTTSHKSDEWLLMVQRGSAIVKVESSALNYYRTKVGDTIVFYNLNGKYSGLYYKSVY